MLRNEIISEMVNEVNILPPSGEAPPPYTPPRIISDACINMTSITEDSEAMEEQTTPSSSLNVIRQRSSDINEVPLLAASNEIYDDPVDIRQVRRDAEYDLHIAFQRKPNLTPLKIAISNDQQQHQQQLSSPESSRRAAHSPVMHSPVAMRRSYSPHTPDSPSTPRRCYSPSPRRRDVISTPPGIKVFE